ncbi:MAG: succinate dehydrogenase, cytochrome b556 subunit [Alphaproteobacteria bacterium]|nr:succinate dehydrogenase, cytochrome b556 subunit [Alphaproteobacteria bacterium]
MASETSAAAKRARPLSPHLQIYKPQITSVLSILHRITGVALSVGTLLLVLWIVAVAFGDDGFYAGYMSFLRSGFGMLMLFGWTVALFYHLLNGIRHLFWDAGIGFDLETTRKSGLAVLAGTAALSVAVWAAALAAGAR